MATDASLATPNAAMATFSALSRGRSSMPGGRRSTLGEGVKGGLSGRIASDASRITKNPWLTLAKGFSQSSDAAPGQPRTPLDSQPRATRRGARCLGITSPSWQRRGRPRAPVPLLLWVLQYVTTCPNIPQHRRPRPRGGRPRPPRARSWACTRPPPRRREARRGRGRGST